MEEGPEPQELYEQVERSHEAAEERAEERKDEAKAKLFTTRSAVTASILAVLAALGSLLAGHTANDAILKQTQATDQWALFQAKSTKGHIFEGSKEVVATIAALEGKESSPIVKNALSDLDKRIKGFEEQKAEIQKKAQEIESDGGKMFDKHQHYSLGVMFFQIAIVFCSVSILIRSTKLYLGSIICGALGIALIAFGFFF